MSQNGQESVTEEDRERARKWLLFIRNVNVDQIMMVRCRSVRELWLPRGQLAPEIRFGSALLNEEPQLPGFRALFRLDFNAKAEDAGEVITFSTEYVLSYSLTDGALLRQNPMERFCRDNAPFHAWPYSRMELARHTEQMGLPPFLLPTLIIGPGATVGGVQIGERLDMRSTLRRLQG